MPLGPGDFQIKTIAGLSVYLVGVFWWATFVDSLLTICWQGYLDSNNLQQCVIFIVYRHSILAHKFWWQYDTSNR